MQSCKFSGFRREVSKTLTVQLGLFIQSVSHQYSFIEFRKNANLSKVVCYECTWRALYSEFPLVKWQSAWELSVKNGWWDFRFTMCNWWSVYSSRPSIWNLNLRPSGANRQAIFGSWNVQCECSPISIHIHLGYHPLGDRFYLCCHSIAVKIFSIVSRKFFWITGCVRAVVVARWRWVGVCN